MIEMVGDRVIFYNSKVKTSKTQDAEPHQICKNYLIGILHITQKRQKLVKLVLEDGWSINKARKKLGIKPSTAKLIVKKFKSTGTYSARNQPRTEDKEPEEPEEPQNQLMMPAPIYNMGISQVMNQVPWFTGYSWNEYYNWMMMNGSQFWFSH